MKTGYIIGVESSNPEFETDSQLRDGIQVDGFFLVAIRDGKPAVECINGMATMDLARFFTTGSEVCSVLRQAAAIGEGIRNAEKIKMDMERRSGGLDAILQVIAKRMKQEPDDLK